MSARPFKNFVELETFLKTLRVKSLLEKIYKMMLMEENENPTYNSDSDSIIVDNYNSNLDTKLTKFVNSADPDFFQQINGIGNKTLQKLMSARPFKNFVEFDTFVKTLRLFDKIYMTLTEENEDPTIIDSKSENEDDPNLNLDSINTIDDKSNSDSNFEIDLNMLIDEPENPTYNSDSIIVDNYNSNLDTKLTKFVNSADPDFFQQINGIGNKTLQKLMSARPFKNFVEFDTFVKTLR
ncbi:14575_t:CDS:2, partial [Ambispora leptoticha]